jgi:hypothetical protein
MDELDKIDKELENDPDWLRAKAEAKRKDQHKLNVESIETNIRYSLPTFKFIGFLIVVLLALILWRIW